jgi:hypothetical protein
LRKEVYSLFGKGWGLLEVNSAMLKRCEDSDKHEGKQEGKYERERKYE